MPRCNLTGWALAAVITSMPLLLTAQNDNGPILLPKKRVPPPPAATTATLLVMCDLSCNWSLDGKQEGHIEAGVSAKTKVELGQHLVTAATEDGLDRVQHLAEVKSSGQTVATLELKPLRAARVEQGRLRQEAIARDTWTDPANGLMWQKKDNGSDVNLYQAAEYCKDLHLDGYSDWRLPEIDELQGIYDPSQSVRGYGDCSGGTSHVKGQIQLACYTWSNSQGYASGEALGLNFFNGVRGSSDATISIGGRALCVRRSRE